jgi:hypothetical protein
MRKAAKIVFVMTLVGLVAIGSLSIVELLIGPLSVGWRGGIAGGIGALLGPQAKKFFDRRWPKPKPGWAS